jgi:hypothetical protein
VLANIEAIFYITDQAGNYHIITEFSKLPIETFQTKQEAEEFIDGYQRKSNITAANQKGWMFRDLVEEDLKEGIIYQKVSPLDFTMPAIV